MISIDIGEDYVSIMDGKRIVDLRKEMVVSNDLWFDHLEIDDDSNPIEKQGVETLEHGPITANEQACFPCHGCNSDCFSVKTEDLTFHFGADWLKIYEEHDWMLDIPIAFDMVEPESIKAAVLKLANILGVPEPKTYNLDSKLVKERREYYALMMNNRYINFTFSELQSK